MLFRILNHLSTHKQIRSWFIFAIITIVVIAIGALKIGVVRSFNLVVGSLFILFFPGWFLSFITFPMSDGLNDESELSSRRALDIIERCTLAVALSIIISSIIVFVLYNFLGSSKLTPINFIVAAVFLNSILFAVATLRKKRVKLCV